jgi:hypothetical protein
MSTAPSLMRNLSWLDQFCIKSSKVTKLSTAHWEMEYTTATHCNAPACISNHLWDTHSAQIKYLSMIS